MPFRWSFFFLDQKRRSFFFWFGSVWKLDWDKNAECVTVEWKKLDEKTPGMYVNSCKIVGFLLNIFSSTVCWDD